MKKGFITYYNQYENEHKNEINHLQIDRTSELSDERA